MFLGCFLAVMDYLHAGTHDKAIIVGRSTTAIMAFTICFLEGILSIKFQKSN